MSKNIHFCLANATSRDIIEPLEKRTGARADFQAIFCDLRNCQRHVLCCWEMAPIHIKLAFR